MRYWVFTGLFCLLIGCGLPAWGGLIITPTFDSSIINDPNHDAIEGAINAAIAVLEADFTNPIDIPIYFQEGGGLGQSNFGIYNISYATFHTGFTTTDANPAAVAGLDANGGAGSTNPVTGGTTIEMKSANTRALDPTGSLGLGVAPGCQLTPGGGIPETCGGSSGPAYDGVISLNTSITSPPNTPSGSTYDLTSVALHEIDEIMGLGSALENVSSGAAATYNTTPFGAPSPEDLFRWDATTSASRTLGTNCASPTLAFLSYGPSSGAIAQFNNECNGSDFGDWCSDASCPGFTIQVQNAFGTPGTNPTLGSSEIAALSAIGYAVATPEPAFFFPVSLVLGWFFYRSRRRN